MSSDLVLYVAILYPPPASQLMHCIHTVISDNSKVILNRPVASTPEPQRSTAVRSITVLPRISLCKSVFMTMSCPEGLNETESSESNVTSISFDTENDSSSSDESAKKNESLGMCCKEDFGPVCLCLLCKWNNAMCDIVKLPTCFNNTNYLDENQMLGGTRDGMPTFEPTLLALLRTEIHRFISSVVMACHDTPSKFRHVFAWRLIVFSCL